MLSIAKNAAENAKRIAISFINDPGILKDEFKDIKTLADMRMNECVLEELEPTQISIISEDNNYYGNYHNLYAMSFARKLIISSSTFYWWGAYLASKRYNDCRIICDNNFPNKKTCIKDWKIF